jgi:hypothetical protein
VRIANAASGQPSLFFMIRSSDDNPELRGAGSLQTEPPARALSVSSLIGPVEAKGPPKYDLSQPASVSVTFLLVGRRPGTLKRSRTKDIPLKVEYS